MCLLVLKFANLKVKMHLYCWQKGKEQNSKVALFPSTNSEQLLYSSVIKS